MTRVCLAALAAACLAGPAAAEPTTEPVPIAGGFHRVVLRVPFRLEVTEGETAVTVTTERPVRDRLRVEVRGDDLVVDSERELPWGASGLVAVRMKEFRGLRIDGSGDARVVAGPAPRDVSLEIRGSGDASFRGAARSLAVEIAGSGDVRAEADAESVSIEVGGSGNVVYAGRAGSAEVEISGSGNVKLGGSGQSLAAETDGSGDVDASGFPVKQARVETRGSGDVSVRLDGGTLRARISGSGDVSWSGTGEAAEVRISGSGDVRRR
ncbi:MAG TPA: DUF2807 domain-containing protein [Anaeromyxobacteraceae bacterium]|nr:DUF2807 domain-containing protein [Anaeromyxobacteraceae bacterium]